MEFKLRIWVDGSYFICVPKLFLKMLVHISEIQNEIDKCESVKFFPLFGEIRAMSCSIFLKALYGTFHVE